MPDLELASQQVGHGSVRPLFRLQGIRNAFGDQVIHDGLDLDIRKGEILGIVGGSGSGKSVLLRTLLGLQRPRRGRVLFEDKDIFFLSLAELVGMRRKWGVLFQNGALFSSLTVLENIEFVIREHLELPDLVTQQLALVKLQLVGLTTTAAGKYPSELSGGMVKRAALARALALDPWVLFLDEPTAGLDPIAAAAFDELIMQLHATLGLTVVVVTHDLDTLVSICDRIAVLVDKRLVVDTLERLMHHDNAWIKAYFRGPRMRAALSSVTAMPIDSGRENG